VSRDRDTEQFGARNNGELFSFGSLYEAFRKPLYRYCLSFVRDTDLAEDATQEAFVRLHRDLGTLHSRDSVRCWLFTVARNEMLAAFRRRRFQVPMEDSDAADEGTPATIFEREESADLVRRMMNELAEEYREVLVLREFEGFSYAEIAGITSSSLAAVKSRLFHARKALAGRLAPWFEERSVQ
jgi:RNA polymerase sigma-70 factor (ECF subfamily)